MHNSGNTFAKPFESGYAKYNRFLCANRGLYNQIPRLRETLLARTGCDDGRDSTLWHKAAHYTSRIQAADPRHPNQPQDISPKLAVGYQPTRHCPKCARGIYHTGVFDLPWTTQCPIHDVPLVSNCPKCERPWPKATRFYDRDCDLCNTEITYADWAKNQACSVQIEQQLPAHIELATQLQSDLFPIIYHRGNTCWYEEDMLRINECPLIKISALAQQGLLSPPILQYFEATDYRLVEMNKFESFLDKAVSKKPSVEVIRKTEIQMAKHSKAQVLKELDDIRCSPQNAHWANDPDVITLIEVTKVVYESIYLAQNTRANSPDFPGWEEELHLLYQCQPYFKSPSIQHELQLLKEKRMQLSEEVKQAMYTVSQATLFADIYKRLRHFRTTLSLDFGNDYYECKRAIENFYQNLRLQFCPVALIAEGGTMSLYIPGKPLSRVMRDVITI